MKIQLGKTYRNITRNQTVEVIAYERGRVQYRVIYGNSDNTIKEFFCSFERFLSLYVPC